MGSPDYIFNDVFFHDVVVMLELRSLEGDLAGHLPLRSTFHSYVF